MQGGDVTRHITSSLAERHKHCGPLGHHVTNIPYGGCNIYYENIIYKIMSYVDDHKTSKNN